jgi:hypothetical protein
MLDRRDWISHHLAANHFPPLPSAFVDAAERAIDRCCEGKPDEPVELPGGGKLSAEECVRAMHLRRFVEFELTD